MSVNWRKIAKIIKYHIFTQKIEKNWLFCFLSPKFLCFLDLVRCWGAASNPLAGRVFEVPALELKPCTFMAEVPNHLILPAVLNQKYISFTPPTHPPTLTNLPWDQYFETSLVPSGRYVLGNLGLELLICDIYLACLMMLPPVSLILTPALK